MTNHPHPLTETRTEALGYTHPNALMSHLNYKGYRPRNGTPSLTARMAHAALGNAIREEVRAA